MTERKRLALEAALPGPKPETARERLRIIVRDLTITCRIGVSDGERGKPQRLRLNLELEVEPPVDFRDDIAGVVDYSAIVRKLRTLVAESENVLLLETLADRLLKGCFADPRVRAGRLRVEKLDRYADLGGLGIELERQRP